MKVADFDYELPRELVAQEPAGRRDASRLMVLERETGRVAHRRFVDLPDLLAPGDLLVLNDTRVVPARLWGRKPSGGKVELLLLERQGAGSEKPLWRALVQASHTPAPGSEVRLGEGVVARLVRREGDQWLLSLDDPSGDADGAVERLGAVPLPPYIHREPGDPRDAMDRDRYQTVYARHSGAVAAPTAGLHLTSEIMDLLVRRGVRLAYVTLHVGLGTFLPVRVERVENHRLHGESFRVPEATADAVDACREVGGRVVAVGTTTVRTLEATRAGGGRIRAGSGRCELFIYPGYGFGVVDAMITNFHLPRSTLLMLVSAFAGRDNVLAAYADAVRERYRFYSYGDAMLVRPES